MNSIGEYLVMLRNEKKITLAEVEKQTKIKQRILQQIENNQFNDLGGVGYTKAIIFSYARFLGADEKKIDFFFTKLFIEKPKPAKFTIHPKRFLLPANIPGIISLIVVVIFLSFLTYYFYQQDLLNFPHRKKIVPQTEQVKKQANSHVAKQRKEKKISAHKDVVAETFNKNALSDTTDYVNQYLFNEKDSPFNVKE
jgi:cytoskeletal protein RodZ